MIESKTTERGTMIDKMLPLKLNIDNKHWIKNQ